METCDIIVEKLEKGEIPLSRLEDALSRIAYVRAFLGYKGKEREYGAADAAYVDAALACLFGDKPFEGKSPVKLKRA